MLPRVWWIGIGRLAHAPFHAAVDHSRLPSARNTISRDISSHIPTIKVISYARQKRLELCGPDPRVFLVAMPSTPDTPATFKTLSTGALRLTPSNLTIPEISPVTPTMKWKPLKNAQKEVKELMEVTMERAGGMRMTRFD